MLHHGLPYQHRFVAAIALLLLVLLAPPIETQAEDRDAAIGAMFGRFTDDNTWSIHHQSRTKSAQQRFSYLYRWVMPAGLDRPRLNGTFHASNGVNPDVSSSHLICPAIDLIDAAMASGRQNELRRLVETRYPGGLKRSTFLLLIQLRTGNIAIAEEHLNKLAEAFQINKTLNEDSAWCYLLAGLFASKHAELRQPVRELFSEIDASCFGNRTINRNLRLRYRLAAVARDRHNVSWFGREAADWVPTTMWTSRVTPNEQPPARWACNDSDLHDFSGSPYHYLFYRIPLRGNFDISAETSEFNLHDLAILYAGQYVLPKYKALRFGSIATETRQPSELIRVNQTVRVRICIKDGVCRTSYNGRVVHERKLPADHDPWLAVRSSSSLPGTLKNLRVAGDIRVPTTVNMMPSEDMLEWLPHFTEKIGTQTKWPTWKIVNADGDRLMIGPRRPPLHETYTESLLRYSRPVAEDGVIEYEFRYVPNALHVHPAIGTTAILLNPDGVRTHQVTNGRYELSDAAPDAVSDTESGSSPLPLNANAWNAVRLKFSGDQLNIFLNDTIVYSAMMSPETSRTFGLFRYLDKTGVRLRKLRWRGAWPKTVPSTPQQSLANRLIPRLNDEREALNDSFHHDFAAKGLPESFFGMGGVRQHYETSINNGINLKSISRGDWGAGDIFAKFNVHGDFDISATFEDVQFDAPGESGARLILNPSDRQVYDFRIGRIRGAQGEQDIKAMASHVPRNGRVPKGVYHRATESTSGKLRIARRGNVYHYLFAEEDSNTFFLAGSEIGPTAPLHTNGLHLSSMCLGRGTFSVRWKDLQIAADRLQLQVTEGVIGPKALYVMPTPKLHVEEHDDLPPWQRYCKQRIEQFELIVDDGQATATRSPDPVMIHRQNNFSNGLIYVWTQSNKRPVAIGTVLLEDKNAEGGFREVDEFHSFHDGPLRMTDDGIEKWNVAGAGLTWKELPEAPVPSRTQQELFEQATELSHRFTAELRRRGLEGPALLDEPLYRYSLTENGTQIVGILTAFANDNNPEVLLLLEARRNRNGKYRWHFAGANYTGMNGYLLLDGKYVWEEAPAQFGERSPHRGWFPHENLKPEDGIAATKRSDVRKLTDLPDGFVDIGSPRWSRNRKQILFDTRNEQNQPQLGMVAADGTTAPTLLGPGMMPSMSTDGKQIVFTNPGIMKMMADGTSREQINQNGWGVHWAPDGQHIAWAADNQIIIQNVANQSTRPLLTKAQASRITQVFWNFSWSHDGKAIAFKATSVDERSMIVVAHPNAADKFRIVYQGETSEKITWHPNHQHLCFSMKDPATNLNRLHTLNLTKDEKPQQLPGQPAGWNLFDCDWSSDGQNIVFVGQPAATTLEWPVPEQAK